MDLANAKYIVKHQGRTIKAFHYFFDAWLFAYLEINCYCIVSGPDGLWVVNPGKHSLN